MKTFFLKCFGFLNFVSDRSSSTNYQRKFQQYLIFRMSHCLSALDLKNLSGMFVQTISRSTKNMNFSKIGSILTLSKLSFLKYKLNQLGSLTNVDHGLFFLCFLLNFQECSLDKPKKHNKEMSQCCKNTLSLLMCFLGQYGFFAKFAARLFCFFKRVFFRLSFLLSASICLSLVGFSLLMLSMIKS